MAGFTMVPNNGEACVDIGPGESSHWSSCRADDLHYEESDLDIYVINLDKDVQRLRWMEQQLTAHKLEYLRIAAVNGTQIPHPPQLSHLGPGEIGCLLSHANAWRLIARRMTNTGWCWKTIFMFLTISAT